jgi:PAS domain S-box-containing protein
MTGRRPAVLLVDDRAQNLLALHAILEPLGHELVDAGSGEEALRVLLDRDDFAVILLDVQMPGLDGFETAQLIKQRERTRDIPMIFVTAISKEEQHVFRGYESGAVDYVFKPFNPDVLRAKIAVFVELWEKNEQLRHQAELIAAQELAELRRESAERYRQLADAMPQIVWTADTTGRATYYNRRWFEYTGMADDETDDSAWTRVVHPEDLPHAMARREETLASGNVFEVEYRFRAADGTYRWHLGRAVPIVDADGFVDFWIGTATDIEDRKRVEVAQEFLLECGVALASSLDYREALRAVAKLAVQNVADWCSIEMLEPDGTLTPVAIEHADEAKVIFVRELRERYPRMGDSSIMRMLESREPVLVPDITDEMLEGAARDEIHLDLLRQLGLRSTMAVPLVSHGRVLGAIAFVAAESGHRFDDRDLMTAQALAQRTATAVENSLLYGEVERRARASRVLETIADGVVLLDNDGVVLLWNRAAEAITRLPREQVVGRKAADALPGYTETVDRVPIDGSRPETVPVEIGGRELWLSFSGVRFEEGTVYAFRDLTEDRALEQMRSDFVATVSHELRTPLAAIYGAAVTIRRTDLALSAEVYDRLLGVIAEESDRLAQIVNDVLLASHLDSGQLQLNIGTVDAAKLTQGVVESARAHLPEDITLTLDAAAELPPVAADEQQLRQVLVNLVENAVKYSPDGGPVDVRLSKGDDHVQWAVSDEGLGIPAGERRRVFEKFYRLDPNMTQGVGGTGLGLYICRELVRRFDGRIWVDSNGAKGSTFFVEIPIAQHPVRRRPREKQAV